MVKTAKLSIVGAIIAGAMLGGFWLVRNPNTPTSSTAPNPIPLDPTLTQSANQFAFNLFKETLNEKTDSANQLLSPLGVQFVLTLFLNGAQGETYQEIAEALGFETSSLDAINQFHWGIQQRLRRWRTDSQLVLANSIWIRPLDRLHPDFARVGRQFYALEDYTVDFRNRVEAARRINEWGRRKTQGFVPEVVRPEEIDPNTILAVVNALYLRALWEQPFQVREGGLVFRREDGSEFWVQAMETELERAWYGRTELAEVVGLPYRGGDWVCYVVLPPEGMGVAELVERLDGERWRGLVAQLKQERVRVLMPRFEVRSEHDLIPVLKRLGIREAFEEGRAQFTRILQVPDAGYIYLFKQASRIRVDELGTEAGAVTVAMTLGLVPEVMVNRPFLFVIAERSSGLVLFMGVVRNPEEGVEL